MEDSRDEAFPEGDENPGTDRSRDARVPSAETRGRSAARGADTSGLVIFKRGEDGPRRQAPPPSERLFAYGSQAALAVCLFGFAWAAGSYFSGSPSPFHAAKPPLAPAAAPQDSAERSEMLRVTQKMAGDIQSLKASIEALRAAQSQTAKETAALEGLKTRLEVMKAETGASISELAGKVDRMPREPEAKFSQILERLDRMEHQIGAAPAAGAISAAAPATAASGKPMRVAEARPPLDAADGPRGSQVIRNWVVRDVFNGVALVESPHGAIEVVPGEIIPGAGTVRAIERRAGGWIVITSRGVVDSARGAF